MVFFKPEKNTIIIFTKKHTSFKLFVGTFIHEYTHYLQDLTDYDILDPHNKHEIEASKNELKYTPICLRYLRILNQTYKRI